MIRTRFAPSPTGDLHLGGVWTALASWVVARAAGGVFVLRVEDLDRPRIVPGAEARIEEDLRWLGIDWDEGPIPAAGAHGPYRQSERDSLYVEALDALRVRGRTYACDCSRTEIARVASAPHAGEELVYPGTCRELDPARPKRREAAVRLCVRDEDTITVEDGILGPFTQHLSQDVGDFVLRRGDGIFAYQLAVAVDDMRMQISDVLRGADLLGSTPRQVLLIRLLGGREPRYFHLPLVTAPDGSRLAKRTRGATVRELREYGMAPERIVGRLAHGLGLRTSPDPCSVLDVVAEARARPIRWRREPWPMPREWATQNS